jgi:hypothetical protein
MKYLIVPLLIGGLSIVGCQAQKSDQPKTPTTDQSQTSTGQSQPDTTHQSQTPPVPPVPSAQSKKGKGKTKSKNSVAQWAPCTLPPQAYPFTFWQTCSGVTLNGCTINATCQTANGQSRAASFDTNLAPQCPSAPWYGQNLVNSNGQLCCGWAGMGNPICGP